MLPDSATDSLPTHDQHATGTEGDNERNPLKLLKIKWPRPTEQHCFTLEQVEAIVCEGGAYADLYELAASTGLRIGEIRWLT
jgi:hypothetical protein